MKLLVCNEINVKPKIIYNAWMVPKQQWYTTVNKTYLVWPHLMEKEECCSNVQSGTVPPIECPIHNIYVLY